MFVKRNSEVDHKSRNMQTNLQPTRDKYLLSKKFNHCTFWQKLRVHRKAVILYQVQYTCTYNAKPISLAGLISRDGGWKVFKFYGINYHGLCIKSRSTSSFLHPNSLIKNSVWSNFMQLQYLSFLADVIFVQN